MKIGEVGLLINDVVRLSNFYKLLLETEMEVMILFIKPLF